MTVTHEATGFTHSELLALLHYDSTTGKFTLLKSRARRKKGMEPGTVRRDGYRAIMIKGKWYKAHRLAWLYVYGEFPVGALDHINRDKLDNRISNLRLANDSQNNFNMPLRKDNSSGHRGVRELPAGPRKPYKRYVTEIYKDGKKTTLGTFDSLDEALSVRLKAANDLFGEFASEVA